MQVSCRGIQPDCFQLGIGHSPGPFNRIPKDFQISTETQASRSSRTKDICQLEETDLLATGGKSQVRLGHNPTTAAISNFHAQRIGTDLLPLADCYVDRGISWMHPAFCDQPQGTTLRSLSAEVHLDIVI